jgi:hypothetical protein
MTDTSSTQLVFYSDENQFEGRSDDDYDDFYIYHFFLKFDLDNQFNCTTLEIDHDDVEKFVNAMKKNNKRYIEVDCNDDSLRITTNKGIVTFLLEESKKKLTLKNEQCLQAFTDWMNWMRD